MSQMAACMVSSHSMFRELITHHRSSLSLHTVKGWCSHHSNIGDFLVVLHTHYIHEASTDVQVTQYQDRVCCSLLCLNPPCSLPSVSKCNLQARNNTSGSFTVRKI